eukprot:TRINITY_DN15949_c1_g1_i1.p1 TRINITY_DN15949_c1_g1~~TRINITY_DN15949_c1_g1_i1.p1  ORF type:complete len:876 (-),score=137.62 TRINITY_DN15949_c1_g1_i1:12-2639(-)
MKMDEGLHESSRRFDKLSLRFTEPSLEAEFVQHRGNELESKLFVSGASVFVLCFVVFTVTSDHAVVCAAVLDLAWRRQLVLGIVATVGAAIMALMKAPRILDCIGAFVCELGAVCMFVALTIAVYYLDPYYMAKFHGLDPVNFVASPSRGEKGLTLTDTRLLLAVDTIMTISHSLPIRWCVIWLVDFVAIFGYAFMVAAIGSPEDGNATWNIAMLALLSFSSLVGKRRVEYHERLVFGSIRRMGSFSCEEFEAEVPLTELATSGAGETGAVRDIDSCSALSVPTTTHTGRVFAELERVDSEIRWKLERIAEIGHKERWLIEAAQVRLRPDCILGSGSFGVVVLASFHGSRVAVKLPRSSVNGSTAWHLPILGNELRILRHVRHPNVVLFHGACIDPTSSELAVVLEHVEGQRLDRFLETAEPSDTDRHCILVDMCCALRYLHGQRPCIVHADLKASNILVEERGGRPRPKLVDFGLSRLLTRKAKPVGGTLTWMAIELLRNPGMTPAPSADVFSFGRLAYFVTTGIRPLADIDRRVLVKMAKQARLPPLHWPEDAPFLCEGQALVQKCLEIDASLRPQSLEVYQELLQWRSPANDSQEFVGVDDAAVSPSCVDSSLSWRSGLRMVRESLRPIPPNRPGSAPPGAELRMATLSETNEDSCGEEGDVAQHKPMRVERPEPPPRPQLQAMRSRPALPGLPPVIEGETEGTTRHSKSPSIVKSAEGEAYDSDATSAQQSPLVLPQFSETSLVVMEMNIVDAIHRWNFRRPAKSCCTWHAALARLSKVHRSLRGRACNIAFAPVRDWQCPRCLLMDQLDEDEPPSEKGCDLCGYDPALEECEAHVEEGALDKEQEVEEEEEAQEQEWEEEEKGGAGAGGG